MYDIKKISNMMKEAVEARERHKLLLNELRVIAVNECGFDQDMVSKSSPIDLLDGFLKGYIRGLNVSTEVKS